MSPEGRIPLADGVAIAEELKALLAASCEKIEIAGSIRRRSPTVGDIDLVAVPKLTPVLDMFGAPDGYLSVLNHQLDELCGQQVISQARRADGGIAGWGPKVRKFTFHGVRVQCQAVEADTYGMWILVRTGPNAYAHAFVTPQGTRAAIKDRTGSIIAWRDGLLPLGFSVERSPEKGGFRLHRAHLFVPTPTEDSVYEAIGRPSIPPELRR